MKHINLSSFKGSITEWTELNYVKGGLADEYADIANVKGNYVKKSENLIDNVPTGSRTINGVTIESLGDGTFKCNGTCTGNGGWTIFTPTLTVGQSYTIEDFTSANCFVRVLYDRNGTTVYNWNTQPTSSNYTTFTPTADDSNFRVQILVVNSVTYNNDIIKPMLIKGSTAPTIYQPGSTSGLYIEDNVNDELIPINDPDVLTRMSLNLSKSTSDIIEEDNPIETKEIK